MAELVPLLTFKEIRQYMFIHISINMINTKYIEILYHQLPTALKPNCPQHWRIYLYIHDFFL